MHKYKTEFAENLRSQPVGGKGGCTLWGGGGGGVSCTLCIDFGIKTKMSVHKLMLWYCRAYYKKRTIFLSLDISILVQKLAVR